MSDRFRVLVGDRIAPDELAPLGEDPRFELLVHPAPKPDELRSLVADVDALIVRSATKVTREVIEAAGRLRIIGRAGVGVDTIDVGAATERGIAVVNAPAGNTLSAAELAFALLLSLARRVPAADRSMKEGEWSRAKFNGIELHGKTLGLVGVGRIGGEVASRARAFGMRVVAYDPFLTEERAQGLGVTMLPLDELLEQADALSLHVPLTESTAGMIGAAQLARMRRGALLVNAARGGVVDESALADAVGSGHLGGAALDVFAEEPLPVEHPLRHVEGVVLTPHLGASTREAQRNVAAEIAEAVRDALLHGDLSRAVNAPAVSGERMRALRPLLELGERLGRLATALHRGAVEEAEITYSGDAEGVLRPLAASTLVGVLTDVVGPQGVNFVNALHLAGTRGIRVVERRRETEGRAAEVTLVLEGGGRRVRVTGQLVAPDRARLIAIDDYRVDL
ncbi:MAG: phosphoglycerate dehydrogenase, partial [Gemmatimonadota bacterium]|nr:phosphoglycerate dehydrogenase [Gemmatimonadota bacterium]